MEKRAENEGLRRSATWFQLVLQKGAIWQLRGRLIDALFLNDTAVVDLIVHWTD